MVKKLMIAHRVILVILCILLGVAAYLAVLNWSLVGMIFGAVCAVWVRCILIHMVFPMICPYIDGYIIRDDIVKSGELWFIVSPTRNSGIPGLDDYVCIYAQARSLSIPILGILAVLLFLVLFALFLGS